MICKFCEKEFQLARSVINHQTKCPMNPNRHVIKIKDKEAFSRKMKEANARGWTDKTRSKLSDSMKTAHAEGRAWNIGMNRWKKIPSFAEQKFFECIQNEFDNKAVKREVYLKGFVLDFFWEDTKAVIEVDGKQHEHQEQKARDHRKDQMIKDHGLKVLRIKWSDFSKDPKFWIDEANKFTRS